MVHMGGDSWCTVKDFQAQFPDLKARHVDHLLSYTKGLFYWTIFLGIFYDYVVNCIFSKIIKYIFLSQ